MLQRPKPAWFQSQNLVEPSFRYGRVTSSVLGESLRSASPPVPVTSLNVDPGGNWPWIASFVNGRSGSEASFLNSALLIPSAKSLLSYVGRLTIARISP